jgi:hypothetical protein
LVVIVPRERTPITLSKKLKGIIQPWRLRAEPKERARGRVAQGDDIKARPREI